MSDTVPPATSPAAIAHTSAIVAAYVGKNPIAFGDIPNLIRSVYSALTGLNSKQPGDGLALKPAVPIKKSVTPDYIVCLEDGKRLKMLKRYLRARYNLTPEQYRAKWNLPHDYPIVAANYAQRRSALAKKIGLGRTSKKNVRKKLRS